MVADLQSHLDTFVDSDSEALLFPGRDGRCDHLDDKTFREHLVMARVAIEKPTLKFHRLRATHGTMYYRLAARSKTP